MRTKKNLKKYRWNHCNHMPIQSSLGTNHRLPLFCMANSFIYPEKKFINEFSIGCMINPKFNINKSFKEKVNKCMNTTFGEITQPHITNTLENNNTIVLALLLFYDTRKNPEKASRLLSRVIYTIITNYVCNIYLARE